MPPCLPGFNIPTQLKEQWSQQSSWACTSVLRYGLQLQLLQNRTSSVCMTYVAMRSILWLEIKLLPHSWLYCTELCLHHEQRCWQEQQSPTLTPCIQMCQSECFLWYNLFILLLESGEWFMWAASGVQCQAYCPNVVDRFIWTHWRGRNLPAEAVTESSVWALFTLMAL